MVGLDRTKYHGKPSGATVAANKEKCKKAFNKGWGVLYAAELIGLNKNTVSSYYQELREEAIEKTGEDFVMEQKTAKQLAIKKFDEEIERLNELEDEFENKKTKKDPTWHDRILKCIELRANLEQQRYALEMTPTIDISIDKIIEEGREEIEQINSRTKDSDNS